MILDRLQYFLDDFWDDKKCDQIWALGPCIYHQQYFNQYRKNMGVPWKHIIFYIWESEILRMLEDLCAKLFETVGFNILKIWILKFLKCCILNFLYIRMKSDNLEVKN